MRFGVLGTGRITRRLVADLQSTPGVSVAAIASRDAARAAWSGGQYGIAKTIAGYDILLADEAIDAVYIALPPSLHAPWCRQAAAAGKHILCEKPLAMDYAEAVSIAAACDSAGVRWLDATAWLHHERTIAMRGLLDSGGLGRLRHISAAMSFYRPFQDGDHRLDAMLGGGCLLDLGWYTAGCAIHAAGQPLRVFGETRIENGVVVRATAMVWFDHEVTATLHCGFDAATRKWCEWAGEQASIVCDDFSRPWPDRAARIWVHNRAGEVQSHSYGGSQERNMIAKLCSSDDLSGYHKQALRTQATLDAIYRSSISGAVETIRCE